MSIGMQLPGRLVSAASIPFDISLSHQLVCLIQYSFKLRSSVCVGNKDELEDGDARTSAIYKEIAMNNNITRTSAIYKEMGIIILRLSFLLVKSPTLFLLRVVLKELHD